MSELPQDQSSITIVLKAAKVAGIGLACCMMIVFVIIGPMLILGKLFGGGGFLLGFLLTVFGWLFVAALLDIHRQQNKPEPPHD